MRSKQLLQLAFIVGILLMLILFGLLVGPFDFTLAQIITALSGGETEHAFVITEIRLPRILLALISGAALTLGGFYMQALIKNPLADPYIMGLSTGAGFGINLLILGIIPLTGFTLLSYPIAAFVGGMISLVLVLLMGYSALKEDSSRLLIAGIAISSLFTALTGLLIYKFADNDQIRQILYWTFGSFDKASWEAVSVATVFLVVGWAFGMIYGNKLDVLILGDEQAASLGMNVKKLKLIVLVITVFAVSGTISFTGPIGFVGMMVPHFSRAFNGINHRKNLIFGSLLGGIYLCGCDLLSQIVHPPSGLPIGIVTAILGVPFFLYLLFGSKHKF